MVWPTIRSQTMSWQQQQEPSDLDPTLRGSMIAEVFSLKVVRGGGDEAPQEIVDDMVNTSTS